MEAPRGSLLVYATSPGSVAEEGRGRNGVFTGALLKHIGSPNIEVRDMLTRVRRDVIAATGGEQVPWDSSSLPGSFYFAGRSAGETVVVEEPVTKPVITIEKAYGSVRVETATAGILYLDGARQAELPVGASARIENLETGTHTFRILYEDGKQERRP